MQAWRERNEIPDRLFLPLRFTISVSDRLILLPPPTPLPGGPFSADLKWLLGVNKYCNNNACRNETGRFPMRIEAQCRNFKFWLTFTKNENKLSQIATMT